MAASVVCGGLGGCVSYSYVDSHGVNHVIGLADRAIEAPKDGSGPTLISVATFGIAVRARSKVEGAGLTLGFDRHSVLAMPDNACLDLAKAGPCAALERANAAPIASSLPATLQGAVP